MLLNLGKVAEVRGVSFERIPRPRQIDLIGVVNGGLLPDSSCWMVFGNFMENIACLM